MHGRIFITMDGKEVSLWFNNYSKVEIGKELLPKKDGFDPRPEEQQLIEAVNAMARDNYLKLLKVLVNAGVVGAALAMDITPVVSKKEVALWIANASSMQIYEVWQTFLQAYGFDMFMDELVEEEGETEKKKEEPMTKH